MNFTEGLKEIQGNVIGFNKDHQHFILLEFIDVAAARSWLGSIVNEVTNGDDVLNFRERRTDERPWLNLAFTYAGLQKLANSSLEGLFPPEFVAGMAKRDQILGDVGDNAPDTWIFPRRDAEVHALLIIAADSSNALETAVQERIAKFREFNIHKVAEQRGTVIENDQKHGIDHFGFRDGVSQPGLHGDDVPDRLKKGSDPVWPGEFVLGYRRQNPEAIGEDTTAEGPIAVPMPEWTNNGSYLVVRRLQQKVAAFKDFMQDETKRHGLSEALFKAKLIGRYPSGEPLVGRNPPDLNNDPGVSDEGEINNFTFEGDPKGELVPLGAHIRRLHPREQAGKAQSFAQTKRILRRGIPYVTSTDDMGLLFISYQRSIADQFEFLQQSWANDPYFPSTAGSNIRSGRDPLIGNGRAKVAGRKYHIPGVEGQNGNLVDHVELMKWVTMTGGGYFFSPGKSALGKLADGEILNDLERDLAEVESQRAKAAAEMHLANVNARAKQMQEDSNRLRAAAADEVTAAENELAAAKDELTAATANGAAAGRQPAVGEALSEQIGAPPILEIAEDRRKVAERRLEAAKRQMEVAKNKLAAAEKNGETASQLAAAVETIRNREQN